MDDNLVSHAMTTLQMASLQPEATSDTEFGTTSIIAVVVQTLISFWTISANGLVLVTVCGSRQLRSVMTSFLISLAAADFLLGVGMILSITLTVWSTPFWPCLVTYCILIGQCVASVWSLMGVAVDRYLHVVGYKMKLRITELSAKVAILMVWTLSVITAVVPLFLHVNSPGRFEEGKSCFDFTVLFSKPYLEFVFYGHECVPVLLMGFLYFHIIVILLQRMRRIDPTGEPSVGDNNIIKSRKELKVVIKLVILLTVFSICTFPMVIGILLEIYNPNFILPPLTRLTMVALIYMNSAINPILFWFFNVQFRRSCGRLFRTACDALASCAFCPRAPAPVLNLNSRFSRQSPPSPSNLPTINLTTYHCDEMGCKRTDHRENIHNADPARDEDDKTDEMGSRYTCNTNPDLPGKVFIDVDVTRSEESTVT